LLNGGHKRKGTGGPRGWAGLSCLQDSKGGGGERIRSACKLLRGYGDRNFAEVVNEKGCISFAAREGRGAETAGRRESDETFFGHKNPKIILSLLINDLQPPPSFPPPGPSPLACYSAIGSRSAPRGTPWVAGPTVLLLASKRCI
jgi:hypothetical protein